MSTLWKIGEVVGFVPREEPLDLTALQQASWCAVQTERGREMTAQANLIIRKIPFYLPTMLRPAFIHRNGQKRNADHPDVVRPLFPSLLFIPEQIATARLEKLRYLGGINRNPFWYFAGKPAVLSPTSIQAIRYIEAGERELYERAKDSPTIGYRPAINDEVKLLVNSVVGSVNGRISALDDRGRIILLVEIMKRQVRVHVTADQITPV